LHKELPGPENLLAKPPKDFRASGKFGFNDGVKLSNGNIHWGTTIDGLPHGYGRMKFAPKFCKNTQE